ncbi:regulatory-associated protein of mTOR-like isoform X3 [Panonychus citri]|uniref:regulatory-associated protein of mTOR-like isoform X3 n=1 Tax=Panonychus citri TaxID=50023 RepID=UPI002307B4F2|nr:regulatory-associated protein of mTOR-like isoform X3 [Panonychus citri]
MRDKVMNYEPDCVEDIRSLPDWNLPVAFSALRLEPKLEGMPPNSVSWRMKERMKTVSVALVLCLNVGVDPPDILKTQPCAKLECWVDPFSMPPQKALEAIGSELQKQYERWQPRARYKQSLDPTVDDVKKFCTSLRRGAKDDRVLLHYNGHGVPKPTINGEIWVFNKTYTQYIPLSLYDLQQWMGSPSIYVYDCSCAGLIVQSFNQFAIQHEREYQITLTTARNQGNLGNVNMLLASSPNYKNCIQLAACAADQILPMNPDLPADLFTSCLTTPLRIALRWFIMQNSKLIPTINLDLVDSIPGSLSDRRTMLGELNWIFTAITDTIAWNVLPRETFQRLFRQDLLVASLFRNFLLADRIMRSYNCTPVSSPKLPSTYHHPMWQAWDLAVDNCLHQLPLIKQDPTAQYRHSSFFSDQLTAFQVWLTFGKTIDANHNPDFNHPEQLPIVLQVLLSQVHRLKALELLGRFLDLGPWAVNMALSVGIFPYVLKLLQSSARELRPLLVFIWAKILAVDGQSCQEELIRDNGHKYFLNVLSDTNLPAQYRTMAAFVLGCIVRSYHPGQEAAYQGSLIAVCLEQLTDSNAQLRQWITICLGLTWNNYDAARWCGVRDSAHEKLFPLLNDDIPEVRAATVFALGTFITGAGERTDHANTIDHSIGITLINTVSNDGSPLVRKELVCALQCLILLFENQFVAVAYQMIEDDKSKELLQPNALNQGDGLLNAATTPPSNISGLRKVASRERLMKLFSPYTPTLPNVTGDSLTPPAAVYNNNNNITAIKRISSTNSLTAFGTSTLGTSGIGNVYSTIWKAIMSLGNDPHPDVSNMAQVIIDEIKSKVQPPSALSNDSFKESRSDPSSSEPSSPATHPTFVMSESPPQTTTNSTQHQQGLSSSSSHNHNNQHTNNSSTRERQGSEGSQSASGLINSGGNGPIPSTSSIATTVTGSSSTNNLTSHTGSSSNLVNHSHHPPHGRHSIAGIGYPSHAHVTSFLTPYSRKRKIFGREPNIRISEDNTITSDDLNNTSAITYRSPLVKTDFIGWCIKFFNENCVKYLESSDPESASNEEKEWRLTRNYHVRRNAVDELSTTDPSRTEEQIFLQKNSSVPSLIQFHPYEPHLIVAERESFSVWTWDTSSNNNYGYNSGYNTSSALLGTFSNANSFKSRISSSQLVNSHDITILLLACDDGNVKAWKLHSLQQDNSPPQLVTAFQILDELTRSPGSKGGSGIRIHWNQESRHLIGAGDSKMIRIWDSEKEARLRDLPTGADCSVTSLSSDGSIICAGCQDGTIRLFDERCSPNDTRILTFREHAKWVVNAHLYPDNQKHVNVLSASTEGIVKFWDKRSPSAIKTIAVSQGLTSMAIHPEADVFACGTSSQSIHIYTLDGLPGSIIRYHDGFMSQRISPISCLAYHPLRVNLAAGCKDSYISVYSSPKVY